MAVMTSAQQALAKFRQNCQHSTFSRTVGIVLPHCFPAWISFSKILHTTACDVLCKNLQQRCGVSWEISEPEAARKSTTCEP